MLLTRETLAEILSQDKERKANHVPSVPSVFQLLLTARSGTEKIGEERGRGEESKREGRKLSTLNGKRREGALRPESIR